MHETSFVFHSTYLRDVSFESPSVPQIFRADWAPQIALDFDISQRVTENELYEVILRLTVKVNSGDTPAFVCEVQQAGLFTISGYTAPEREVVLYVGCPNILFPFAREAVANLVLKGGFPSLLLPPINFQALLDQHVKEQQAKAAPAQTTPPTAN